ncbi:MULTISPECIES: hypothetical protein [Micromonospora]|nr:hypothetical protein [Micromonospora aurantiaca]
MSWQLKKSQGLFFSRTGEPRKSYWANQKIRLVIESRGASVPKDLLNWDPVSPTSRSNCPLVHEMLEQIILLVDPRWRARACNIYAGRTFKNDDMALADQSLRGGMVAISSEFSSAVGVYAAIFLTFLTGVDEANKRPGVEAAAILNGMRSELDDYIEKYKVGGILALKGAPFLTVPGKIYAEALDLHAWSAEQWALAHEVGHHIARDLSSRRDKNVASLLRMLRSSSSTLPIVTRLTAEQIIEVEADILATLIIAGHFSSQDEVTMRVHMAVPGAAIALVTIAHLREEWTTERGDSHPGCLDRLYILLLFICELYGQRKIDKGSHFSLARVSALWISFAHWAEGFNYVEFMGEKSDNPNFELPFLHALIAHYATVFGLASEGSPPRHG